MAAWLETVFAEILGRSMDVAVVGSTGERESIGGRLHLLYRF